MHFMIALSSMACLIIIKNRKSCIPELPVTAVKRNQFLAFDISARCVQIMTCVKSAKISMFTILMLSSRLRLLIRLQNLSRLSMQLHSHKSSINHQVSSINSGTGIRIGIRILGGSRIKDRDGVAHGEDAEVIKEVEALVSVEDVTGEEVVALDQ